MANNLSVVFNPRCLWFQAVLWSHVNVLVFLNFQLIHLAQNMFHFSPRVPDSWFQLASRHLQDLTLHAPGINHVESPFIFFPTFPPPNRNQLLPSFTRVRPNKTRTESGTASSQKPCVFFQMSLNDVACPSAPPCRREERERERALRSVEDSEGVRAVNHSQGGLSADPPYSSYLMQRCRKKFSNGLKTRLSYP